MADVGFDLNVRLEDDDNDGGSIQLRDMNTIHKKIYFKVYLLNITVAMHGHYTRKMSNEMWLNLIGCLQ